MTLADLDGEAFDIATRQAPIAQAESVDVLCNARIGFACQASGTALLFLKVAIRTVLG